MSSTVDTNVLLYASDTSSPHHDRAREFLEAWTAGPDLIYLFWPTIMGYLRISTHPGVFSAPLDFPAAAQNIESLLDLPHLRSPGETDRFWEAMKSVVGTVALRGNLVPDAHVVSLMREHGVDVIWSRDRDLRKFDRIRVRDPFVSRPPGSA